MSAMTAAVFAVLFSLPGLAQQATPPAKPTTVWVLPLEPVGDVPDDLAATLTDLLRIELARSTRCAVVGREHLSEVLAEHTRSLSSASRPAPHELGRLLGAEWMLHGTLRRHEGTLTFTTHLTEVASTRVLESAVVTGDLASLPQLLTELVAVTLPAEPVPPAAHDLARTPTAELHFLRGLTLYDAGHYHRALASFLHASTAADLEHLTSLWQANCYLATANHAQAFLILQHLRQLPTPSPLDLTDKLRHCRQHLSPTELHSLELLLRTP